VIDAKNTQLKQQINDQYLTQLFNSISKKGKNKQYESFYFRVDAWSVGLCPPDPPVIISCIASYSIREGGSVPVEESTTLVHYCLIW
jgi:hypothetical protein